MRRSRFDGTVSFSVLRKLAMRLTWIKCAYFQIYIKNDDLISKPNLIQFELNSLIIVEKLIVAFCVTTSWNALIWQGSLVKPHFAQNGETFIKCAFDPLFKNQFKVQMCELQVQGLVNNILSNLVVLCNLFTPYILTNSRNRN